MLQVTRFILKMTINKNLDEIFDVDPEVADAPFEPLTEEEENAVVEFRPPSFVGQDEQTQLEDKEVKSAVSDDYQFARQNLKDLLAQGDEVLDLAIRTAQASEDTKSIDTAGRIISQLANINMQLLELTKKKQEVYMKTRTKELINSTLNGETPQNVQNQTINQTMFVGSTTELAKMIANLKKENTEVIEGEFKE